MVHAVSTIIGPGGLGFNSNSTNNRLNGNGNNSRNSNNSYNRAIGFVGPPPTWRPMTTDTGAYHPTYSWGNLYKPI